VGEVHLKPTGKEITWGGEEQRKKSEDAEERNMDQERPTEDHQSSKKIKAAVMCKVQRLSLETLTDGLSRLCGT